MNPEDTTKTTTKNRSKKILVIALLIALVGSVALIASGSAGKDMSSVKPDRDMNQAVFLNNGEVYFGKITDNGKDFLVLEDIYYLRVTPVLQQQPDGTAVQDPNQQPQINLIKLGEELHGPEDKMVIPMSSVVYWENITDEGQVATAIAEAANAGTTDAQQPAQQLQPAAAPQPTAAPAPVDATIVETESEVSTEESE